jgi:mannosyltransferase
MSTSEYPARPLGEARRLPRLRDAISIRQIPADVLLLGALIVVAAAIRIITIDTQSFWADEALTAYEVNLPFGAMIHTVAHVETTPPLYFVLAWVWAHVFGTSEVALRSISTIAGIALVPIAYLAARDLVSRWAGVIAAAFVTVNPFLIWYSQEARAYMLLAALSGASFLWFVRARSDPSRRNLASWAIFSALALMTHFFAGFLVAPEALWLLWVGRSRVAAAAVAAVGVVQLAMLPLAVSDTGHGVGWLSRVPQEHRVSQAIMEWAVSLLLRRGTISDAFTGLAALAVIVVLLLAVGGDRRTRRGAAVAAALAMFVFLVPLALKLVGQDYFYSRNEIPAFVPFATVIAAACAAPRARVAGTALAIALLVMFSAAAIYVQTHSRFERPNWRRVAHALGPAVVPRAILAADGTTADPLKIYLPNVDWTQPYGRKVRIAEIDVVGATKHLRLVSRGRPALTASVAPPTPRGPAVPRTSAPHGARLVARFHVSNWVIARFVLKHPERLSINRLSVLAPEFFRHTPASLLVFTQPAERAR